jgi:hypothetical protein
MPNLQTNDSVSIEKSPLHCSYCLNERVFSHCWIINRNNFRTRRERLHWNLARL